MTSYLVPKIEKILFDIFMFINNTFTLIDKIKEYSGLKAIKAAA